MEHRTLSPVSPHDVIWWTSPPLHARMVERWHSWARSPNGRRTITGWATEMDLGPTPISTLSDPVQRCGFVPGNHIQAHLVALAQSGSSCATATLMVQLRPGLVRLAGTAASWPWSTSDSQEARGDVQAAFLEVLYGLDLQRRRKRVAANLINDTRQRLWRASPVGWSTGRSLQIEPAPGAHTGDEARTDVVVDLGRVLRLIERHRPETSRMVYLAWIEERPVAEVAGRLGVSPATVANRLYRLRNQLRVETVANQVLTSVS